jgi:2-succinyl-6-hydroxy-2,4-cyclohexadiene-1-carboxylate synthase
VEPLPSSFSLHPENPINKQKQSILLLHGFMGKGEDFQKIFPASSDIFKRFNLISCDLPGHGHTPWGKHLSLSDVAEDIIRLFQSLPNATGVIGYSMGGRVLFEALSKKSSFCDWAVILSANPGLQTDQQILERQKKDRELINPETLSDGSNAFTFLNNWYKLPLFGEVSKRLDFPSLLDSKMTQDWYGIQNAITSYSVSTQVNFRESLPFLSTPLLYLSGAKDISYSQIGKELAKHSPHIEHKLIPHAGHNLLFESEEVENSILSWMELNL